MLCDSVVSEVPNTCMNSHTLKQMNPIYYKIISKYEMLYFTLLKIGLIFISIQISDLFSLTL